MPSTVCSLADRASLLRHLEWEDFFAAHRAGVIHRLSTVTRKVQARQWHRRQQRMKAAMDADIDQRPFMFGRKPTLAEIDGDE